MSRRVRSALVGLLAAGALVVWLHEARGSPLGALVVLERRGGLDAELRDGARLPDWAGEYVAGDGLGDRLVLALAPRAGFLFERSGCLGTYERDWGGVRAEGDVLVLERGPFGRGTTLPGRLHVVRWGERVYLVPDGDVLAFANRVNGGLEPRETRRGRPFLRLGDEERVVDGLPRVPAEHAELFLDAPVDGTVLGPCGVGGKCVRVDRGARVELRIGLELRFSDATGTLVSVDEHDAVCALRDRALPAHGSTWSTRYAWAR